MAGKNNAKPAKQTEPAKDAAVVTTTGSASESEVTQAGQAEKTDGEKTPGVPATVTITADGKDTAFDAQVTFPAQEKADGEGGKQFALPSVLTFEGTVTYDPAELKEFIAGLYGLFASLLADAGVLVRKDGQEVPPTGDDILAFSMRDEGTAIVTADGRKFMLLKEGQFNEAQ